MRRIDAEYNGDLFFTEMDNGQDVSIDFGKTKKAVIIEYTIFRNSYSFLLIYSDFENNIFTYDLDFLRDNNDMRNLMLCNC